MMQTAFVEKTAQLQALQQEAAGQQEIHTELAALHQDMLGAQVHTADMQVVLSSLKQHCILLTLLQQHE